MDVGIIQPARGKGEPSVGPDALMVMIPSTLKYLVQLTKAEKLHTKDMYLHHFYQAKVGSEPPLTLSGPFLGAPHAVIGMEKLIVLGAKRIWVLGWCGSLQADLQVGHVLVLHRCCFRGRHFRPLPHFRSPPGVERRPKPPAGGSTEKQGLPFSKGPVWTTDAIYRETPEKVKTYQDLGVLAVEMEMSALMTLAIYRSVAVAGLLVVSDELSHLNWRPGFSRPLLEKNTRAAGEVLIQLSGSVERRNFLDAETR